MVKSPLCRIAERTNAFKPCRYTPVYDLFFSGWRHRPLRLLEIGVAGGGSLLMWRKYFPRATLFGLDIEPQVLKWNGVIPNCTVQLVDQGNAEEMRKFVSTSGGHFDVIIDDGGHYVQQMLVSFQVLFEHLNPGGAYVIEDIGTNYWESFGGGDLNASHTMMGALRNLVDAVNIDDIDAEMARKWGNTNLTVSPDDVKSLRKDIGSVHFYPSLGIVFKAPTPEEKQQFAGYPPPHVGVKDRLKKVYRKLTGKADRPQ